MKKEVIRHHFSLIDSTNHWLKEHRDQMTPDTIVLVTANEQIAGRGRQGHLWKSPKDVNLYASFGFFWKKDVVLIPLLMAVVVSELLEGLSFEPQLKWPNDILLNGKKVSGILCEVFDHIVILGLGLNINMTPEQLKEIDQAATSLFVERGAPFAVEEITMLIADKFASSLERSRDEILEAYKKRLMHRPGDTVSFHDNGLHTEGRFEGLDGNGFLQLTLPNGERRTFSSGHLN